MIGCALVQLWRPLRPDGPLQASAWEVVCRIPDLPPDLEPLLGVGCVFVFLCVCGCVSLALSLELS